jgi:nucleoside-triphosphatase
MKIIITGSTGVGKSTILKKYLSKLDTDERYGYTTARIIENGNTSGFEFVLFSGKRIRFAHINLESNMKFGKYFISIKAFQQLSEELFLQSRKKNILVIDELGLMEQSMDHYVNQIKVLYKKSLNSIIIIQQRSLAFWKSQLSLHDDKIILINKDNRDYITL